VSLILGFLTILFGFLDIKFKKFFVMGCVVLALCFMLFGDNKFYSFVYYFFSLGLSQLLFITYITIKEKS